MAANYTLGVYLAYIAEVDSRGHHGSGMPSSDSHDLGHRSRMSALDVYALACLADGPVRAVDTAVVTLLLDGRLRAEPTGALGTAALRYDHPVEAAVLDAVGRRALRSIGTVRFRAAADDRLTGLVAELAVSGLLRRVRRPPLLRRGRPGWVLTDAGRSALREARRAGDDRVPARVALDGLDALPDQDLRRRVF